MLLPLEDHSANTSAYDAEATPGHSIGAVSPQGWHNMWLLCHLVPLIVCWDHATNNNNFCSLKGREILAVSIFVAA